MNLPYPSLTKLPTEEVDETPELWNKTYREIDANLEALRVEFNRLDTLLRNSNAGGNASNINDRLRIIEGNLSALEARYRQGVVKSVAGRSGNVVLTVEDVPGLARRSGDAFDNVTLSDDNSIPTDFSFNESTVATKRWFTRAVEHVFGTLGFQSGDNWFKMPYMFGSFFMCWGRIWCAGGTGRQAVHVNIPFNSFEYFGGFVQADSAHGGEYAFENLSANNKQPNIYYRDQRGNANGGNNWWLVIGRIKA